MIRSTKNFIQNFRRFLKETKAIRNTIKKNKKWRQMDKDLSLMTPKDWEKVALKLTRKRLRLKKHPLEQTFEKLGLLESRKAAKARVWKADATPKKFKIKRNKIR